jgi:hypothetical protein
MPIKISQFGTGVSISFLFAREVGLLLSHKGQLGMTIGHVGKWKLK